MISKLDLINILKLNINKDNMYKIFNLSREEKKEVDNLEMRELPEKESVQPNDFAEIIYLYLRSIVKGMVYHEAEFLYERLLTFGFSKNDALSALSAAAKYCDKNDNLEVAMELNYLALKQFEFNLNNKDILVAYLLRISQLEFRAGIVSRKTVLNQKKALEFVNDDNRTQKDSLLMLYHGVEIFFCEDEDKGAEIREKAIQYLSEFDNQKYAAETELLIGWHYSFSGKFTEAISQYEMNVLIEASGDDTTLIVMCYPSLLFAYLFTGEYNKALSMNELLYKQALKQKNYLASILLYSMLGRTHIYLKNYDLAGEILYKTYAEALQFDYPLGKYYALFAIAYLHLCENNINAARASLELAMKTAEEGNLGKTNGSPFFYDILRICEEQGLEPIAHFDYREQIYKDLNEPNIHLSGISARHIAELMIKEGGSDEKILYYLNLAIERLSQSGNGDELANAYIAAANYHLACNRAEDAKKSAQQAYNIYDKEGRNSEFPVSLTNIVVSPEYQIDLENLLRVLFLELEHIINEKKAVSRLMTSFGRYIKAENGVFFKMEEDAAPKAMFFQNIERESEQFQTIIGIVTNVARTGRTFLDFNKSSVKKSLYINVESKPKVVLCIPLKDEGKVEAVMYLESYYRKTPLSAKELAMAEDFVEKITPHMLMVLNYTSISAVKQSFTTEVAEIRTDQFACKSIDQRMKEIEGYVEKVAWTDVPILITGESGVGKEIIARKIFMTSNYSKRFLTVNCGAIPETLIESELFGYERGSFTGADKRKQGYFEAAEGGTIFLDEIGELPLLSQVKLLRVIQEGELMRVGGVESVKANCRIIAATNKKLEDEIAKGTFREDLYYRLNILQVEIPPLRARRADISNLSNYFIEKFCKEMNKEQIRLSNEALMWMLEYDWPGNVRELENVIHRAVIVSNGDTITLQDIEQKNMERNKGRFKTLNEVERDHIIKALNLCGGKLYGKNGAAEILGIKRTTLIARMEKLGITNQGNYR